MARPSQRCHYLYHIYSDFWLKIQANIINLLAVAFIRWCQRNWMCWISFIFTTAALLTLNNELRALRVSLMISKCDRAFELSERMLKWSKLRFLIFFSLSWLLLFRVHVIKCVKLVLGKKNGRREKKNGNFRLSSIFIGPRLHFQPNFYNFIAQFSQRCDENLCKFF